MTARNSISGLDHRLHHSKPPVPCLRPHQRRCSVECHNWKAQVPRSSSAGPRALVDPAPLFATHGPATQTRNGLQTRPLVVAQVIAECATDSPVWIIACTIQSLQSRVYGRTSVGARLNATTGKPRFRGAAQPARARWSTPRLSSQHTDQQPKPGTDFRLAVLTK